MSQLKKRLSLHESYKMCSFRDSALRCCGLWRYFAQQPESQDLSQSQKIPWRSEDTLWGRSSCEEFCVSRHQTAWEHYRKEKPVKKHNIPPLSLTSDVAPALDSSEKEKTHKDIRVGCSHSRLCAALQLGNTRTGKFPSTSFSWEATQCPQPHLAVVLLPLLNPCWDKSQQ